MLEIFRDLVAHFGGQESTAFALEVNQSTVSGWVRGKHAMSAETALLAQIKTNGVFLATQLRPSLAKASLTLSASLPTIISAHQSGASSAFLSSAQQVTP